jgi:hypothetical protein
VKLSLTKAVLSFSPVKLSLITAVLTDYPVKSSLIKAVLTCEIQCDKSCIDLVIFNAIKAVLIYGSMIIQ